MNKWLNEKDHFINGDRVRQYSYRGLYSLCPTWIMIVIQLIWFYPLPGSHHVYSLPKALSRCISMFCPCFFSSTFLLSASTSRPITRSRVLKIRVLRAVSADLLLSIAFFMDWSTGKSTLYIFSVSNEDNEERYITVLGMSLLEINNYIKSTITHRYIDFNLDLIPDNITPKPVEALLTVSMWQFTSF